ncbi:hypothetical protein B0J18DRAFT_414321 [Chaetomium sp. MPI-SDFR-AT-0129]|nr:hypothetical protein B0J18DRAFT_414321 [Chaetomium sp. MPI-SDFR-AT-0129]
MALDLDHRGSGPPSSHTHRWIPSPASQPVVGALRLISRQQHQTAASHMLQPAPPPSFTEAASALGLFDVDDVVDVSTPFMPGCCPIHDRLRPDPYYHSVHGSVYYTPDRPVRRSRGTTSGDFPAPLIRPCPRRPHSIHIVSYPPGFVPHELRPLSVAVDTPKDDKSAKREKRRKKKEDAAARKKEEKERRREEKERCEKSERRRSLRSLSSGNSSEKLSRVFDKIFAAFAIHPAKSPPSHAASPSPSPIPTTPGTRSRPSSFISFARRLSRIEQVSPTEPLVLEEPLVTEPTIQPSTESPTEAPVEPLVETPVGPPVEPPAELPIEPPTAPTEPPIEPPTMTGTPIARPRPQSTSVMSANRNSVISMRSAKSMMSSSTSEIVQKPVASGSGVSCSILLAEPNVFLTGLDHDHHTRRSVQSTSALLRGKLQLNVSKNVKIKSVTLKLVGKARTEWPEGIPPAKSELCEEHTLRTQSLVFFHAMHEGMWDTEYGSQCTYSHKSSSSSSSAIGSASGLQSTPSNSSLQLLGKGRSNSTLTAKEYKRLSLQSVNSRSFGKGDSPHVSQVQCKGYKVFRPGTYEYSFELPIDHSQLETAKLPFGSVRWDLETTVERAGAFKPNLHGSKEVTIVRLPDQMSLETVEPISISRHWEDQLHYDIIISGKSFPIGGRIPIAFKLTPLAKVQIHKLKVYATENIEYWTNDRHVTRKDAGRKILLLEKAAGKPLDKQYAMSDLRVLSGGELEPEQREEARQAAAVRRLHDASWLQPFEPLPEPSNNLLGDLDLGLESFWGSTEIEMNVQLPTCEMMARDKAVRLHPDCSWKNVNVFHWIKIVMRISRADADDPTGKRRRHFEISIDSPFTVLNCRATQTNTALPQYSGSDGPLPERREQVSCGCPDAQPLDPTSSMLSRPLTMVEEDIVGFSGRRLNLDRPNARSRTNTGQSLPNNNTTSTSNSNNNARPEAVSAAQSDRLRSQTRHEPERPIHLIRHPSHNPPAFDADEPPPQLPLQTPPPQYDMIVGTPSVDGLADYFARLAAYEGEGGVAGGDDGVGLGVGVAGGFPGLDVPPPPAAAEAGDGIGNREAVDGDADADSDTNTIGPDDSDATPEAEVPSVPVSVSPSVALSQEFLHIADAITTNPSPTAPPPAISSIGPTTTAAAPAATTTVPNPDPDADIDPFSTLSLPLNPPTTSSSSSDTDDEDDDEYTQDGRTRLHRGGRVNVANPRTPGGRLVPSRSLEIERPSVRLDMTGVLRRRARD